MPNDRSANDARRFDFSDSAWQHLYETDRTGWDRGEPSPALTDWIASGHLSACRILVPGCGRGHEVVELAAHGFQVTAIDFATAALEDLDRCLKDRNLTATLICDDVLNYRCVAPFDAIYEQTCLCALLPEQRTAYATQLADWLKPGGLLLATFMQVPSSDLGSPSAGSPSMGPPFHCEMKEMRTLFHENAWQWISVPYPVKHPSGLHEMAAILRRATGLSDNS